MFGVGSPTADLHIDGNVFISGSNSHITASGNISSSGNVRASRFEIDSATNYIDTSAGNLFVVTTGDIAAQPGTGKSLVVTGGISATTNITASGDISSSANITANNFSGIFNGALSSSAQLSTDISGSFVEPSASFSTRVTTAETELENTLLSGSAQIATDISGSFVAPSGSFSTRITTAETELGNTLLSGSAQIATDISGSLSTAAVVGLGAGIISGSSSNSNLTSAIVTEGAGILSGSAQIAGDVSGSFTSGFEFTGKISGSSTSTGSFGSIETDGDINVSGKLAHAGDPDTRILFADDDINITVGNVNMIDFTQDTISEVTFNEAGADVDFRIETANDSKALYINAGDDTIQLGSAATTHVTASGNISGSGGNILGFKDITATGNITAQGDVIAENYIVSSSVTYMTSSVMSGSTRWGDTPADDTHLITGSMFISGSGTDLTNTMTASFASVKLQHAGHLSGSLGTITGVKQANITSGSFDYVNVTGNVTASSIETSGDIVAFGSSDRELKDDIQPIENPLEKMDKIGGYTFVWNDNQNVYKGKDVGVVAQEIQSVLPEIVATRANGYLGVKYEKIVPLLIESIKENTKKIKELEQEINEINKNCDCLNK